MRVFGRTLSALGALARNLVLGAALLMASAAQEAGADPTVAIRGEGFIGFNALSTEVDLGLIEGEDEEQAFTGGGAGSIALGLSDFYLQADVFGDRTEYDNLDAAVVGGGGHVGWRNPEMGAVGAVATYNEQDRDIISTLDLWRAGFEGEAFFDRLSLAANVGYAETSVGSNELSNVYVDGRLAYYPNDRLRLHAMGGGFSVEEDEPFGIVGAGVEFLALDPLAFFTRWEASIFDESRIEIQQHNLVFGARLYWGAEQPSLIAYDRSHFKPACFGYQLGGGRFC